MLLQIIHTSSALTAFAIGMLCLYWHNIGMPSLILMAAPYVAIPAVIFVIASIMLVRRGGKDTDGDEIE